MSNTTKRFTHPVKGGEYEVIGTSLGAGPLKGLNLVLFRDVKTGQVFHREPENFFFRMKPIKSTDDKGPYESLH